MRLELARGSDITEDWSLSFALSGGWGSSGQGEYCFGADSSGISEVTGSVGISRTAGQALECSASANAARVIDECHRAESDHPDDVGFVPSLALGF